MPIARTYKPGSIIYFEGDKATDIYILQSGKVVLRSRAIDSNEEIKEPISAGEFFGVKSVLGKYPREATAQVLTQSVVLVMKPEEFENLVYKNFRILMKMLKVFSNQLRRIGKKVQEMMKKGEAKLPSTEMFYIGEYYLKKGKIDQAKYVYSTYLKKYPGTPFVEQCKKRLEAIERGEFQYAEQPALAHSPEINEEETIAAAPAPPIPPEDNISSTADTAGGIDDFFSMDEPLSTPPVSEPAQTSQENSGLENLGGLGASEPATSEPEKPEVLKKESEGIDVTKKYYEGLSLFSQEKYEDAINIYKSILEIKRFKNASTAKFAEKAMLELGKTYMKLEKYTDAIETFSNLIKKFQRTDLLKDALYNIALSYEKMQNYKKAINFYQKVMNTPPKEAINSKARKAIEELQNKL